MKSQGYPVVYENGKKAIIYIRVSTEEQVENFSLDTQEELCRKEAKRRGYEIVQVFREEGRSAKTISGRPMLINLLEYCRKNKRKVQAVFIYRIDRISRVTADYLAIRKKLADCGVNIISTNEPTGDSPTEKLVETILIGFAQLDNDIRSERTKNGLRARFLSGLLSRKPPLGYISQGGFAVKDTKIWDNVKKAWDLMATGTKSLKEMAIIMNEWGLRENTGKKEYKLRPQTVNRIFRSKFYMGILTSDKYTQEVRGQHVPMITEEQFYRVQAILDGRNPHGAEAKRSFENDDFPLRRIIKCGKCGQGLTGGWSRGKCGGRYAYYFCSKKCNYKSIKVAVLEQAVIDALKAATLKKECLELLIHFLYKSYHDRNARLVKIKNEADEEIARLKTLRNTLVEKNLSGIYSDEVFKEQNAMIEEKVTNAYLMKDNATFDKYNIDEITSFMKTLLADLGEAYKRSNIPQLKVLLGLVFPSGLSWDYNGTLNYQISPLYQYIRSFSDASIPIGDPSALYIEPALTWFTSLMEFYQNVDISMN